jgi:hypothetical protein
MRLIPLDRMRVKPGESNKVTLWLEGQDASWQVAAWAHDGRDVGFRDTGEEDRKKGQADDGWPACQENQIVGRSKGSWHAQEGQEGG